MSAPETNDRRQASVRADPSLLNDVDRALLEARASGHLPMDYNRSDALRDLMRQLADDPSILSDYSEDAE